MIVFNIHHVSYSSMGLSSKVHIPTRDGMINMQDSDTVIDTTFNVLIYRVSQ